MRLAILGPLAALVVAPTLAQTSSDPIDAFLRAADKADTEAMEAAMDPDRGLSSKKLFRKIEGCYLEDIRSGPSSQWVAVWLCAEGEDKSRTILLDVSETENGALVEIAGERKNDYAAPERQGSLFGKAGS